MKQSVLLQIIIASILLGVVKTQSQTINSAEIYPENPTSADSTFLITSVTTANYSVFLESGLLIEDNNIVYEACYFQGGWTVVTTHEIDFNLGLLPAGEYDLDFNIYLSDDEEYCSKVDSASLSIDFVVTDYLSVEGIKKTTGINIFPNPANNLITISNLNSQAFSFEIISTNGQVKKSDNNATENVIDISELKPGIYILKIDLDAQQIFKKLIKE